MKPLKDSECSPAYRRKEAQAAGFRRSPQNLDHSELQAKNYSHNDAAEEGSGPPIKAKPLPDISTNFFFSRTELHFIVLRRTRTGAQRIFYDSRKTGPGNSLGLSPIESLWTIIKEELSKLSSASLEKTLFQNAETWQSIKGETLEDPICVMPSE